MFGDFPAVLSRLSEWDWAFGSLIMSPLLVTVCFEDSNTVVIKVVGERAELHRMSAKAAFRGSSVTSGTVERLFAGSCEGSEFEVVTVSGDPNILISKAPPFHLSCLVKVGKIFCHKCLRGIQWGWLGRKPLSLL